MDVPRILLTSVHGPYARDVADGSRRLNPMELYHNQVTREQGPFSLRMFHRSWGLMMIQSNIQAPCTVLDFPDLARFTAEIRDHEYDVVGISSIVTNLEKTRRMCDLARRYRPGLYVSLTFKREARRLANGWRYEPPTFYEKNAAAIAIDSNGAAPCRHVDTNHRIRVQTPALTTAGLPDAD